MVLTVTILMCLSSAAHAQYDSLSEIRTAVRFMTNYTAGALADTALTPIINIAARHAQVEIKGAVEIDTIKMSNGVLSYQLNSNAMHGDIFGVLWKNSAKGVETALMPIDFPGLGKIQQSETYPAYYQVIGDLLVISSEAVDGDSLFVHYPTRTDEMTGANDTAGLDETDDAAVVFLACSFVCASRGEAGLAAYWLDFYKSFKNSRTGVGAIAPQE